MPRFALIRLEFALSAVAITTDAMSLIAIFNTPERHRLFTDAFAVASQRHAALRHCLLFYFRRC